jgi:hypothetical protein
MQKLRVIICGFAILLANADAKQAAHGDLGLLVAELRAVPEIIDATNRKPPIGMVKVWNTTDTFHIQVLPDTDQWLIKAVDIYVGYQKLTTPFVLIEPPYPGSSTCYSEPVAEHHFEISLKDDLGITWGRPDEEFRTQTVAVWVLLTSSDGAACSQMACALNPCPELTMEEQLISTVDLCGYQFAYECMHPSTGHFIDSPVSGLTFKTPTHWGRTGDGGSFNYFSGETVELAIGDVAIGKALASKKVSPLNILESADTDDQRVVNMARLLQSLDADAEPQKGIRLTTEVEESLVAAMVSMSIDTIDFANDEEIDELIDLTMEEASGKGVSLAKVSPEDAKGNLDRSLDSIMFRKNVSKTAELASAKSKMNDMGVWFPALKANGDSASYTDANGEEQPGIGYFDENGDLIRVAYEAKPLVVVYCDAVEETGMHDVFAAVSRDDGNTWKRKNVSRMADRSSFLLENGEEAFGHCKKPVFQVKENKILIAWTSKFSRGGKPRYAITVCPDIDGDGIPDPCTNYTGSADSEGKLDYPYDDPYYEEDIWGVSGPQLSVTYDDYPEVGEVPYSAVWTVRGMVLTQSDINNPPFDELKEDGITNKYVVGDIVWFKPERLTSARRDANQVFLGAAEGAGFGLTWQEDPEGLQPGEAKGPGPGWGGATTSHKTDIWYSFLTMYDFAQVDTNFVSGGDPEHDNEDFAGRVKALVPMSLPVRISDNETVNTENMMIATNAVGLPVLDEYGQFIPVNNTNSTSEVGLGAHRYGYLLEGLWNWNTNNVYSEGDEIDWEPGEGGALYAFTNQQEALKRVVITADGRALDGNTGASRPNIFLQTYTKKDGTKSAWAIMAYEETKGVGSGPDDETGASGDGSGEGSQDGSGYDPYDMAPDEGKNAIYHSFEFQNPDLVSAGMILNLPETDTNGVALFVVEPEYAGSVLNEESGEYDPIPSPIAGQQIIDWKGDPVLAYENARRPRFILQSKTSAFGGFKNDGVNYKEPNNSGTVLMVLYKEGEDGAGRQSDIIARRCVVKNLDGTIRSGNPWDPKNFLPHSTNDTRAAVQNVSTMRPGTTWINPERDDNAKGDGVKVCDWDQPEECRWWKSGVNPYEDARAHRGAIRGDFLFMGYSYTPNWAASRNAHDKYDFYIRRSFNGGETWTTDPETTNEVVHIDYFINPDGVSGSDTDEDGNDISEATKHYTVTNSYAGGGVYEPARNVSLLKNNKSSVIEPRIVAVPGTYKVDEVWTGIAEDKQNPNVCYLAFGTSVNLKDVDKAPEDLFLTFTDDKGTTLFEDEWSVSTNSSGNHAGETVTGWIRLAKGDPEQGEVQLRMTPDGSRVYACWLEESEDEGSDVMFRRIMPMTFPSNVSTNVSPEVTFEQMYEVWADASFGTNDVNCGEFDDFDGDGQCNVEEFIVGHNPTHANAKFCVKGARHEADGFVVEWTAVEGRKYDIYWAEDLGGMFEPVASDLHFPQGSYTDSVHSAEGCGFYYIDVQLAE